MAKYKNLEERLGNKANYYVGSLDLSESPPYSRQDGIWQCEKCGEIFELDMNTMATRYKCHCDECRWQEYLERPTGRTHQWLLDHGLEVTKEQTYDELRSEDTGRKLRFDFCAYLEHEGKSYIWLIELDGVQHDEYSPYYHDSYEDFEKQQRHDEQKEQFCKDNGINLIRIKTYKEEVEDVLEVTLGLELYLIKEESYHGR